MFNKGQKVFVIIEEKMISTGIVTEVFQESNKVKVLLHSNGEIILDIKNLKLMK
ncbi:hypothetical protein PQE75_gp209 [Bacillus phage vB_BcoS-136]|uniref:Uncharacterized protein n=1 Tax=Bacillus phage vB_BcoS-136 TaxID=2419619 RepID=A0A3G3BVV5_9CAUD|nr:hypothetical protein PQE75_gp209 [Bacillus phage vB_BcoS-136]AYP68270.1 hypothetical protein vBBcoS136_00156 [Bacillus phage vB_BcoS-136]